MKNKFLFLEKFSFDSQKKSYEKKTEKIED